MRSLTPDELRDLELTAVGRRPNPILAVIKEMGPKEVLLFDAEEWELKTPPAVYVASYFRPGRSKKKFSVRTVKGQSTYVVTRLK